MRTSPFSEHKLVLQEFAATSSGQEVLRAAASALGMGKNEFEAIVMALPLQDFYIPDREQRRSWTGDGDVSVLAPAGRDWSRMYGYSQSGAARVSDRRNRGARSAEPFSMVLHPAERKLLRMSPTATGSSTVVEDSNEPTISAAAVEYLPNGDSVTTYFRTIAELRAGRWLPSAPQPQRLAWPTTVATPMIAPGDSTFLWEVAIVGVCDMGDCYQNNEFEWKAYFKVNGADESNRKLYVNLPSEIIIDPFDAFLINRKPRTSAERLEVGIVESDYGPDDEFGTVILYSTSFTANDGGGFMNVTPLHGRGAPRCDYQSSFQYLWLCGSYIWQETNQDFRRTTNP